MRVLTFSRVYPAYHPKKGQPTEFVSKIWNGLRHTNLFPYSKAIWDIEPWDEEQANERSHMLPKHHTIRAGHRWKIGEWFSPRVWSGKPYRSKQIEFAPPIQVKKTWEFKCDGECFTVDGKSFDVTSGDFAVNDGLSADDLLDWFPLGKTFTGQIICWNENINY